MMQGSGMRMPSKGWRFYFSFTPDERRRFWVDVVGALTFRLLKESVIDWLLAPFYFVGWKLITAFVAIFIFGETLTDKKPAPPATETAATPTLSKEPRPDSSYWGPSPGATQSTSSTYYGARADNRYMSMDQARAQDQQAAQRNNYESQLRQNQMAQTRTQIQQPSYATPTYTPPASPSYTPARTTQRSTAPTYTPPPTRSTQTYTAPRATPAYTPARTTPARTTPTYTAPRPTPTHTPPRPTPITRR